MTAPVPADPPLTTAGCKAWAQPEELGATVQDLMPDATWCAVLATATDVLWAATGRRWRNVSLTEAATVEPTAGCYAYTYPPSSPLPRVFRQGGGLTASIRLPRDDVTAVTAVTVDGVAFTEWRVDGSWLTRTDGQWWPASDTINIAYTYGRMAPIGGRLAVLVLATETGRWLAGQPSALPSRVTSVTRQGISFSVLNDLQFLRDGLTEIPAVDMWILSVNPSGVRQQAEVWSPDLDAVTARRT